MNQTEYRPSRLTAFCGAGVCVCGGFVYKHNQHDVFSVTEGYTGYSSNPEREIIIV